MKLTAYVLGLVLIAAAAVYLVLPADSLPSFLPGHEPGLPRIRLKHGLASGAVGVVLLAVGWWLDQS